MQESERGLRVSYTHPVILSRRSAGTDEVEADTGETTAAAHRAGKGRPTPKRADARKARRNAAPTDRKEAAKLRRERDREERRKARTALVTGDERNLPARDAGPDKRLARDIADSQLTYGQYLFGLIAFSLIVSLVPNTMVKLVADVVALVSILLMIFDASRVGRKAKGAVMARHGDVEIRGIFFYAFARAMLPRRFRRPPPKVQIGDQI